MISGRTRFYLVAGVVGAILGEALAGALMIGVTRLISPAPASTRGALAVAGALLVGGIIGGAYVAVLLMRTWYRRRSRTTGRGNGDG